MVLQFKPYKFDNDVLLTEMIFGLYHEGTDGSGRMTAEKVRLTINHYKKNKLGGKIYLLYFNADMAGYAIVNTFWSNEYGGTVAFLDELFVREQYRSNGIGAQFIQFLEGKKFVSIFLEVYPSNKLAYDFYKRHGFEISQSDLLKKDL